MRCGRTAPRRRASWRRAVALAALLAASAGPAGARGAGDAAAVRGLLEARPRGGAPAPGAADPGAELERFYADRGYEVAWIDAGAATPRAREVAALLRDAARKGLDPADYDGGRWEERLDAAATGASAGAALERARLDLALTAAAMRYASDLAQGRVAPRRVRLDLDVPRGESLAAVVREKVLEPADLASAVAALEPPFAAYRRTLRALEAYEALAREDDGEPLPQVRRAIAPGDPYAGVPRLARLLRRVGDLAPDAEPPPEGAPYAGALVDAVARFQRRHGLELHGRLDRATLAQLGRPLSRRAAQLRLTLERWRWLPHGFATAPIVVNVPEFRLHAGDAGQRWSMRVVVGRAYRNETPVFAGELRSVVFRPSWSVPLAIQRDELVPKAARRFAELEENGYELVDARWRPAAPASEADALALLRSGALRLRQRPGPRNALGLVKFLFPNVHDVYLHDTPSRELFQRARRDFSHGCIRLEDPVRLAAWVLGDAGWTPARVREAMSGPATLRVELPHPVPVLILYGTAIVAEDGEVRFFEDLYGHDAALERALAARRFRAD